MRIYFSAMRLPKKAAKRIQKHYTPETPVLGPPMLLHEALRIAALMLGYEDWHELERVTKSAKHPPSLLDEQASVTEQSKRIDFQTAQLGALMPLTEPQLRELALKFRVSAGAPFSSQFADDSYRQNALFYWEPYGEDPEWRFRPSARSREQREDLYDLIDQWGRGELKLDEYIAQLQAISELQPENLVPYLCIIEACGDIDAWAHTAPHLPKLETAITASIPPNYPMKRKVAPLNWYTIDNRDYLRSLYHLAVGYYAVGNFNKAKQWFLFLTRCCSIEMGHEQFFLIDLRQASPEGDLHRLEGKELCDRYLDPVTGKRLGRS